MFGSPGCLIRRKFARMFFCAMMFTPNVSRAYWLPLAWSAWWWVLRTYFTGSGLTFFTWAKTSAAWLGDLSSQTMRAAGGARGARVPVPGLMDEAISLVAGTAARHAGHGWPANDVEAVLHLDGAHRRFREHLDVLSQRKLTVRSAR